MATNNGPRDIAIFHDHHDVAETEVDGTLDGITELGDIIRLHWLSLARHPSGHDYQHFIQAPAPAPWGVHNNRYIKLGYPPTFPSTIRDLIRLIPNQDMLTIGRNIRQMVLDVCIASFDPVVLRDIGHVLSRAPDFVLKDLADCIAGIACCCWVAPAGIISLHEIITTAWHQAAPGYMTLGWLYDEGLRGWTRDDGYQRMSRFRTRSEMLHSLYRHVEIHNRPWVGVPLQVVITPCLHESVSEIGTFMAALPVVPIDELGEDDSCAICLQTYVESVPGADAEEPVKLPCGHAFGNNCLSEWLEGTVQRSFSCPLCRTQLAIP